MSNKDHAEKAARALNDLSMLHAVMALCESSLFYTKAGNDAAAKITAICKRAAQRQLVDHDNNMEAIEP